MTDVTQGPANVLTPIYERFLHHVQHCAKCACSGGDQSVMCTAGSAIASEVDEAITAIEKHLLSMLEEAIGAPLQEMQPEHLSVALVALGNITAQVGARIVAGDPEKVIDLVANITLHVGDKMYDSLTAKASGAH
jgi:hypothetical protein